MNGSLFGLALLGYVPSFWEWGVLLLILVLIFGARKLPELGRGLGEGIKNFRGAMKEMSGGNGDSDDKSGR